MNIETVREIAFAIALNITRDVHTADDVASDIAMKYLARDDASRHSVKQTTRYAVARMRATAARRRAIERRNAIEMQYEYDSKIESNYFEFDKIDAIDSLASLASELTSDECITAATLANCENQSDVAALLNVSRSAVCQRIEKIREKFSDCA